MLNTVQYKHTSQTLYVCYVEHRTIQTHISNTMRMLLLNTVQYKHTSQTLYVCYVEHRTI